MSLRLLSPTGQTPAQARTTWNATFRMGQGERKQDIAMPIPIRKSLDKIEQRVRAICASINCDQVFFIVDSRLVHPQLCHFFNAALEHYIATLDEKLEKPEELAELPNIVHVGRVAAKGDIPEGAVPEQGTAIIAFNLRDEGATITVQPFYRHEYANGSRIDGALDEEAILLSELPQDRSCDPICPPATPPQPLQLVKK
jgi:hypothetical protein